MTMDLSNIKCFVCGGRMVAEDQTIDYSRAIIRLACARKPKIPCLEVSLKVELDLKLARAELHTEMGNGVILLNDNLDYAGMVNAGYEN
jgi:hypothetical protein